MTTRFAVAATVRHTASEKSGNQAITPTSRKAAFTPRLRWSRLGVFNKIFAAHSAKGGKPDQLMIDATHLKAHRTAASLLKKWLFPDVSDAPKAG